LLAAEGADYKIAIGHDGLGEGFAQTSGYTGDEPDSVLHRFKMML